MAIKRNCKEWEGKTIIHHIQQHNKQEQKIMMMMMLTENILKKWNSVSLFTWRLKQTQVTFLSTCITYYWKENKRLYWQTNKNKWNYRKREKRNKQQFNNLHFNQVLLLEKRNNFFFLWFLFSNANWNIE